MQNLYVPSVDRTGNDYRCYLTALLGVVWITQHTMKMRGIDNLSKLVFLLLVQTIGDSWAVGNPAVTYEGNTCRRRGTYAHVTNLVSYKNTQEPGDTDGDATGDHPENRGVAVGRTIRDHVEVIGVVQDHKSVVREAIGKKALYEHDYFYGHGELAMVFFVALVTGYLVGLLRNYQQSIILLMEELNGTLNLQRPTEGPGGQLTPFRPARQNRLHIPLRTRISAGVQHIINTIYGYTMRGIRTTQMIFRSTIAVANFVRTNTDEVRTFTYYVTMLSNHRWRIFGDISVMDIIRTGRRRRRLLPLFTEEIEQNLAYDIGAQLATQAQQAQQAQQAIAGSEQDDDDDDDDDGSGTIWDDNDDDPQFNDDEQNDTDDDYPGWQHGMARHLTGSQEALAAQSMLDILSQYPVNTDEATETMRENEHLHRRNMVLWTENNTLWDDNIRLSQSLTQANQLNWTLLAEQEVFVTENLDLIIENETLRSVKTTCDDREAAITKLAKDIVEAREEKAAADAELAKLRDEVAKIQQERIVAALDVVKHCAAKEQLEKELEARREEEQLDKRATAALYDELAMLKENKKSLQKEMDKLKLEYDILRNTEVPTLNAENVALRKKNEELSVELQAAQTAAVVAELAQIDISDAETSWLKAEHEVLLKKNAELEVGLMIAQTNAMAMELAQFETNDAWETKIAMLNADVEALKLDNAILLARSQKDQVETNETSTETKRVTSKQLKECIQRLQTPVEWNADKATQVRVRNQRVNQQTAQTEEIHNGTEEPMCSFLFAAVIPTAKDVVAYMANPTATKQDGNEVYYTMQGQYTPMVVEYDTPETYKIKTYSMEEPIQMEAVKSGPTQVRIDMPAIYENWNRGCMGEVKVLIPEEDVPLSMRLEPITSTGTDAGWPASVTHATTDCDYGKVNYGFLEEEQTTEVERTLVPLGYVLSTNRPTEPDMECLQWVGIE